MSKLIFKYDRDFARQQIFKELYRFEEKQREKIIADAGFSERYKYDVKEDNKDFPSLSAVGAFARIFRKPIDYFIYRENIFKKIVKEEFLNIPYIEPFTDEENNLVYKGNKHMCAFRFDSLLKIAKDPLGVILYVIETDTMESTLSKGDEILIDIAQRQIKDGAIYAFNSFNMKYIRVRRFYCEINNLKLIADNKTKYEAFIADPKDINILGQVIASKHYL